MIRQQNKYVFILVTHHKLASAPLKEHEGDIHWGQAELMIT